MCAHMRGQVIGIRKHEDAVFDEVYLLERATLKKRKAMGTAASRENGQATSVRIKRAGGYVQEVHRAISAQEVMLHNPKHWVTKLGIFRSQNPITEVVPPEAVLMQGQTFLLVPFKTMRTLLERQRICPASLDHLMDRPGLAIREWYHQQQESLCIKRNSSKGMMAVTLSKESSVKPQTQKSAALESDIKPCTQRKMMNRRDETTLNNRLEASKDLICKDAMHHVDYKSIKVPFTIAKNYVKHQNMNCFCANALPQPAIEKGMQHSSRKFAGRPAFEGSMACRKNQQFVKERA